MSVKPTFADFSVDPNRLSNAEVTRHRCRFSGSHLALDAGGSVTVDFEVEDPRDIPQATLTVTALVSELGSSPGHAPIDVLLQGEALAEGLTVPGGGDLPQDNVFAVPGRLLKQGTNTLEIRSSAEARSMLWLYRITLDPVYERGRSERARAAEAARDSVFAYRTERRPAHSSPNSSTAWQAAPPLLFHIDRGEHSLPAQLGWRGEDGSESAVSFQSSMSDFHGCHRAADGTAYEYRGRLTGRWTYPEGLDEHPSASVPHRGGVGRQLARVRFVGAPAGQAFTGYYQRHNEGPIGYRSTPVATVPDLEAAVQSPTETARTLAAPTARLRTG